MNRQKTSLADKFIKFGQVVQTARTFMPTPEPEHIEPQIQETGPMEGLASSAELERYIYGKKSFFLGNIHPDHGTESFTCGINDDRHIFIMAGNAAGKGRSLIIQNALRWKGGFVALDPKGELASITAMRRGLKKDAEIAYSSVQRNIGQDVVILDPFSEVVGPARLYCKNYNPLSDINISSKEAHGQIRRLASSCIVPEEGNSSHFSEGAETLLCGAIEVVLYTYPKERQNLVEVRKILAEPFDIQELYFKDIDPDEKIKKGSSPSPRGILPEGGFAAEALSLLEKAGENEAGSFDTTVSKNLKWLSDPLIKEHITSSDKSLAEIVKNGGSVYIVIPPDKMDDFKNWMRVILQTAISAKISLGVNQNTQQTLFMLDEFPLLGRFKVIEKSAGYLRGYNCKLVCAIQNIGQIKTLYTKNWETFLGNAGAIIGFAMNDYETEEYLSKRSGKILAWETTYSQSSGANSQVLGGSGGNIGKSVSQAKRERAVRLPNEIHEQGARETMRAFVIPADGKMFTILRQNYDDIKTKNVFDSPQFCVRWEQKCGKYFNKA